MCHALTVTGSVYVWGSGNVGQTGLKLNCYIIIFSLAENLNYFNRKSQFSTHFMNISSTVHITILR
jgi:hypothetical protein